MSVLSWGKSDDGDSGNEARNEVTMINAEQIYWAMTMRGDYVTTFGHGKRWPKDAAREVEDRAKLNYQASKKRRKARASRLGE